MNKFFVRKSGWDEDFFGSEAPPIPGQEQMPENDNAPYTPTRAEMQQDAHSQLRQQGYAGNFDQAARGAFKDHLDQRYLDAEEQTRGHMLNPAGKAKGIDPRNLFHGPMASALAYASPELKEHWNNAGRPNFGDYKESLISGIYKSDNQDYMYQKTAFFVRKAVKVDPSQLSFEHYPDGTSPYPMANGNDEIHAFHGDQHVGVLRMTSPQAAKKFGETPGVISWVHVNPDYRGNSIGQQLLTHAQGLGYSPIHAPEDELSDDGAKFKAKNPQIPDFTYGKTAFFVRKAALDPTDPYQQAFKPTEDNQWLGDTPESHEEPFDLQSHAVPNKHDKDSSYYPLQGGESIYRGLVIHGQPIPGGKSYDTDWHHDVVNRIQSGTASAQDILSHGMNSENAGDYWHHPAYGTLGTAKEYAYAEEHPGNEENMGYGRDANHAIGEMGIILEGAGPKGWEPQQNANHNIIDKPQEQWDPRIDVYNGNSFLPQNTQLPLKRIHYHDSSGTWHSVDATGHSVNVAPQENNSQPLPPTTAFFVRSKTWNPNNGDLTFQYKAPTALYNDPTADINAPDHRLDAFVNGEHAGYMQLDDGHGRIPHGLINMVSVKPQFQGKGIARELGNHFQNEIGVTPIHSDIQSGKGVGFAQSTPEWGTFNGRSVYPGKPKAQPPAEQFSLFGKKAFFVRSNVPSSKKIEGEHTGGMIALIPDNPKDLKIEGGDPEEQLHLTLAYLGEAIDWSDEDREELLSYIDDHLPAAFEGKVLGHAEFNPDDKQCSVYLVSEVPKYIETLRADLMDNKNFEIPDQHNPWVAHITAGFDLDPNKLSYTGPVSFSILRVVWAGNAYDFPLKKQNKTAFYVRKTNG